MSEKAWTFLKNCVNIITLAVKLRSNTMAMNQLITFQDANIIPKFSTVPSRSLINLAVNRPGFPYVTLPIISANMDTVTGSEMAKSMGAYGATSCLHRFQTIEENVKMLEDSRYGGYLSSLPMVSIGLGMKELERAEALRDVGAMTFVIDVNHGANIAVVNQAKQLREILGRDFGIIVGNFATGNSIETFLDHASTGIVDGFKVGIGPSGVCSTRIKTGVGIPQLSALMDCRPTVTKHGLTMIADGGMKTAGDVCKAIAAGAHFVMTGGMLAGTHETPGESVWQVNDGSYKPKEYVYPVTVHADTSYLDMSCEINLPRFKKYSGSASKESYEKQGKVAKHRTTEGETFLVPYKGSVADVLQDIEGGLRGSLSMVGAYTIEEYHKLAEFVVVSQASSFEATAHNAGKKL
jgi:IMP dehydrogenase